MVLIEEINLLRKELKLAQRQIRDLQSITGLHKFSSPKEAQKKLQMAVKTREDIYEEYKDQLKVIALFKVFNDIISCNFILLPDV